MERPTARTTLKAGPQVKELRLAWVLTIKGLVKEVGMGKVDTEDFSDS